MKVHIHTKAKRGPIFIGSCQDAQSFIQELEKKFGINPHHCEVKKKKIYLNINGEKTEAHYIKLGKRQGSCFYLSIPTSSEKLRQFLEKNLMNISDIKFVEESDPKPTFSREVPAHK